MSQLRRGDIFFADFGHKYRPHLVVQNNKGNEFSPRIIVVPLTTKIKKHLSTHVVIKYGKLRLSSVHCEEIMCVNVMPEWEVYEHFPPEIMRHVDRALKNALDLR